MLISIIAYSFDKPTNFLRSITLKLTGETFFESPLHQLPELLASLDAKSLNTYGIRFEKNKWGRFDIEIQSEYPLVRGNTSVVDMAKKIKRLLRYYYEENGSDRLPSIPYQYFIAYLRQYKSPYSSWEDSDLYQMSSQWEQLAEAYKALSPETDLFYTTLKQRNLIYRRPPMGHQHCRFDEAAFIQSQMILQHGAFGIVFNYRPQGDTKFHLMINSLQHNADLLTATSRDLFELEALFRTVYEAAERMRHSSEKIMIYMQKHASMGMTMPHLHIHVLLTPTIERFSHDILQEFRFLMTSILHPEQKNPYVKPFLSDEVMHRQKSQLALGLSDRLNKQLVMQYQHFSLFSPPRVIQLNSENKPEPASQALNSIF
jgi:diadenosine tetraphosphate (Ap4A) HIT family hydrolase